MKPFPTTFDSSTSLLPAQLLNKTEVEAVNQLAAKGYEVHIGLTTELAKAIAKMALEPSIREYCPRDCSERFAGQAATSKWLKKGRAVYLLFRKTPTGLELAGYGWAGAGTTSHVPGGETTFALRLSESAQGQGLATPFARLIVHATAAIYGSENFWLETWASNEGASYIYHKLGFIDRAQIPDQRPTQSGELVDDIRLYMSLPNELITQKRKQP